jgi:hypothetical protein
MLLLMAQLRLSTKLLQVDGSADVDLVELNEAFSVRAVAVEELCSILPG